MSIVEAHLVKDKHTARQAAQWVIETIHQAGHVAYLAGGCVRDLLLEQPPKDYDVATDARPERVVQLFKRTDQVGAKFGVVLVRGRGHQIEVATFRSDGAYLDGRHPDAVTFGHEVDDARRRDFTINGMFFDTVDEKVIDHVGGRADLDQKLIRAIGDPQQRFAEDHLRMLRAVRFAARLGFEIEATTLAALRGQAAAIRAIATERVRVELEWILTSPHRARGWELLYETGLAGHVFVDIQWTETQLADGARRLARLPDHAGLPLALAAILQPFGSPAAQAACKKLTCSNVTMKAVAWLLTHLPHVLAPDRLDLADLKLLMAQDYFDDLCYLLQAKLAVESQSLDAHAKLLDRARKIPPDQVAPPPLVTGDDLLALSVTQGPAYARILDATYRAQLNLEITNRTAAIEHLKGLIAAL